MTKLTRKHAGYYIAEKGKYIIKSKQDGKTKWWDVYDYRKVRPVGEYLHTLKDAAEWIESQEA